MRRSSTTPTATDGLDRLTGATGSLGSAVMAYDGLDNLLRYQAGGRDWQYEYETVTNNQHLKRVFDSAGTQVAYEYDSAGNVNKRSGATLVRMNYDRAHRATSVSRSNYTTIADYVYDGLGRRVRTDTPVAGLTKKACASKSTRRVASSSGKTTSAGIRPAPAVTRGRLTTSA